ncbi:hypothetical protein scyTo_0010859 [Scyliorhinus torazame]|uniref:Small ribosomal subunit protein uS13 n=1 Tax=Scyliorhinus torazame TaxID=75743 RepID=A0A401PCH3_SCYTO|nr:hypothetical protein [Scyliorhinus torazame]
MDYYCPYFLGTGSLTAALEVASCRKAVVIGKPSRFMFDYIASEGGDGAIDPARALMIGDRLETDILFGANCGMRTVLLLLILIVCSRCQGVGRRYAHVVLRKADIDLSKRAGELSEDEVERIITIMQNPRQYKIPDWFLNRQKDVKDGKYSQVLANGLDNKLREDLERLKKIRAHRGLRHFWGLRVRGQHTKTTGRRGRTVGVSKKK